MLELGANVNHTDLHNTTPLMDLVSLGDEERALRELARLNSNGRYNMQWGCSYILGIQGYVLSVRVKHSHRLC